MDNNIVLKQKTIECSSGESIFYTENTTTDNLFKDTNIDDVLAFYSYGVDTSFKINIDMEITETHKDQDIIFEKPIRYIKHNIFDRNYP